MKRLLMLATAALLMAGCAPSEGWRASNARSYDPEYGDRRASAEHNGTWRADRPGVGDGGYRERDW
jgi:hypothetical protein